jgi:hypothetical protein
MDKEKCDDLFGELENEGKKDHNMFKTDSLKDYKRKRDNATEAIRKKFREERFKSKRMGEEQETIQTEGKPFNNHNRTFT